MAHCDSAGKMALFMSMSHYVYLDYHFATSDDLYCKLNETAWLYEKWIVFLLAKLGCLPKECEFSCVL